MKKIIAVLLSVIMIFSTCISAGAAFSGKKDGALRLVVPENWELDVGDSRSVDCATKNTSNFVSWASSDEGIATVDVFGRVTAKAPGKVQITASNAQGYTDTVELTVVKESTKLSDTHKTKFDFKGTAAEENDVLQKIVTRYSKDNASEVPSKVKNPDNYAAAQSAKNKNGSGASWEITSYGVLRTDLNASNDRDVEQRFMGDRYFYSADTKDGKVLAIFDDGANGIWTVMEEGYTHIEMKKISGEAKASMMSATSQEIVSRHGFVSEAGYFDGEWYPWETDNDGLWTSMYGAGELMRYAVLKDAYNSGDKSVTEEELAAAKKAAYSSTEAVLLLTYVSMREGTTESNVRAQRNGSTTDYNTGKYYTKEKLIEGGDYSQNIPFESPATMFNQMKAKYMLWGKTSYTQKKDENLALLDKNSWSDVEDGSVTYAKRTRNLEGFWARTFAFKDEKKTPFSDYGGYIYWDINDDGTATGRSTHSSMLTINNENLRGLNINASGEIPERLWNDVISGNFKFGKYNFEANSAGDLCYKGDTSADEVIGHLFLYKLAYDIIGAEDAELKALIANTLDKFAQHITDNGYNLVDGSGQPTTWGKFNRTYFHNGQVLGGAALQSTVALCTFKLAAYVTGDKKWEDEYRMAAFDEQYQYLEIMNQELERYYFSILEYANSASPILGFILRPLIGTETINQLYRMILNYSDEEMGMLAYYLLFQLEEDEDIRAQLSTALDDWWFSISYSENPLWYYIYQLAHPDETIYDRYGNNILETAAWQLSRHPIDTTLYLASNTNRDDITELDLGEIGIDGTRILSYDPNTVKPLFENSDNQIIRIIGIVLRLRKLDWKVCAADERGLHKFNSSNYQLDVSWHHNPNWMEGSTTYTLPYWMGRYHNMLTPIAE